MLSTAHSSSPSSVSRCSRRGRARAAAARGRTRRARGRARSAGPARRRARTAACPACPGAGETRTRSWVISSIRHDVLPEREDVTDPGLVDHLLVELADPAAPSRRPGRRRTARGRGSCRRWSPRGAGAPGRPVSVPVTRSQTIRGRSSANSSRWDSARRACRGWRAAPSPAAPRTRAVRRTTAARSSTRPLLHRQHRDDLLRQDVERVARRPDRLDRAVRTSVRRRRWRASGRRDAWGTSPRG